MLATARGLAGTVRAFADESERTRQCPPALVEILHDHRMFDMILPKTYGGLEETIPAMVRVLEELAVQDGSTGWVVGIGNGTSIIAANMPEATARQIFQPRTVTGGAQAPNGRATPAAGGYRVSGRWPFASGCTHCSWLVGGSLVFEGGEPRRDKHGFPQWRVAVVPIEEIEIIDTWHVSGLRGTGSRDMALHDVYVPEERMLTLDTGARTLDGPNYRFPVLGFLALTIAPIPLGIARRAIDELIALAEGKTPMGMGSRLRDRALTQIEVGRAEAMVQSARAWLFEIVEELWDAVVRGDEISMRQRALLRAACAHAALESARAVDLVYTLAGGSAIYESSIFQRLLRDVHAATQHVMLAPPNYETAGRVLLGLDPPSPMV